MAADTQAARVRTQELGSAIQEQLHKSQQQLDTKRGLGSWRRSQVFGRWGLFASLEGAWKTLKLSRPLKWLLTLWSVTMQEAQPVSKRGKVWLSQAIFRGPRDSFLRYTYAMAQGSWGAVSQGYLSSSRGGAWVCLYPPPLYCVLVSAILEDLKV